MNNNDIHIESRSQRGGITANNVFIDEQKKKTIRHKKQRLFAALATAIATLAGICTILMYFNIFPWRKTIMSNTDDKPRINISSHNQSGGITAHTVNINAATKREFTPKHAVELDSLIDSTAHHSIKLMAVYGDSEAYQLAQQVFTYLNSKGRNVKAIDTLMAAGPPVKGIKVEHINGIVEIIVGSQ